MAISNEFNPLERRAQAEYLFGGLIQQSERQIRQDNHKQTILDYLVQEKPSLSLSHQNSDHFFAQTENRLVNMSLTRIKHAVCSTLDDSHPENKSVDLSHPFRDIHLKILGLPPDEAEKQKNIVKRSWTRATALIVEQLIAENDQPITETEVNPINNQEFTRTIHQSKIPGIKICYEYRHPHLPDLCLRFI